MVTSKNADWVLLSYRIPRDPSTPRIAVWRKLRSLGVAQIGDGLVALPLTDRNAEQLEWVAVSVKEADGDAVVWNASPTASLDDKVLRSQLSTERDDEYQTLLDEVRAAAVFDGRTIQRWRRTWRNIRKRDYFDAPLGEKARVAINEVVGDRESLTNGGTTK